MSYADDTGYLRRRAFAVSADLGLTDAERRELAAMLPGTPISENGERSWRTLEPEDWAHLITWMDGARLVRDLMRMRG